ncbi:MAG: hypothetical protein EXR83_07945 [Gammaproteobacteria bacterium]|nr:hypothetical protein [Gammaproteobacteria bacterium]
MHRPISAVPGVPAARHRGLHDLPWMPLAVVRATDAAKILKIYRRECAARELPPPEVSGA